LTLTSTAAASTSARPKVDDQLDSTKSEESDRQVPIDPGTVSVLRVWRKDQLAERLAWGSAWTDSGRVFTREDGTPLRPGWISQRFGTLIDRARLPPIRFHDLRHGTATMLQGRGVASDASFPGKREDGAVRNPGLSSPMVTRSAWREAPGQHGRVRTALRQTPRCGISFCDAT
jgi:hypothetical protein